MINKIVLLTVFISGIVFSQIDSNSTHTPNTKDSFCSTINSDAKLSLDVGLNTLLSPIYFDQNDLLMMGAVIGITGAAYTLDESVRTSAIKSQTRQLDKITDIGEKFGNAGYSTILSGALYLGGYIFKDKYTRETGQILAEALMVDGIYTMLFKISTGRSRPYTEKGHSDFNLFKFTIKTSKTSFPSGHTSTAFTLATVLSERIDNIYASIGLYSLATLTAYQRVYADVHWLSDTVLGAAIGTFIGLKVVKLHDSYLKDRNGFNFNIFPYASSSTYGVGLSMSF